MNIILLELFVAGGAARIVMWGAGSCKGSEEEM
jgi:hypothetical protein